MEPEGPSTNFDNTETDTIAQDTRVTIDPVHPQKDESITPTTTTENTNVEEIGTENKKPTTEEILLYNNIFHEHMRSNWGEIFDRIENSEGKSVLYSKIPDRNEAVYFLTDSGMIVINQKILASGLTPEKVTSLINTAKNLFEGKNDGDWNVFDGRFEIETESLNFVFMPKPFNHWSDEDIIEQKKIFTEIKERLNTQKAVQRVISFL